MDPESAGPDALLTWFDRHGRTHLPWRDTRAPWAVLVAEVMLQQTGADRIARRWSDFLDQWPTAEACASADLGDLLAAWSGLGYPRRVRNLRAAARLVVSDHGGEVPGNLDNLLALPGVGPYTARAVLAFAFEHDVAVVDTNVGRILARLNGRRLTPSEAQTKADSLVPAGRGWAWNQAILDLGALVCRKRSPQCGDCPVRGVCAWQGSGPDPADTSAAVSGSQAPFAGSDRQLRGEILRRVTGGEIRTATLVDHLAQRWARERITTAIDGLVAEGFIECVDDTLSIAA